MWKAGIVGFAQQLPIALLALPAGALADHVNRKRLMVGCDAARAIALASIPIALAAGRGLYLLVVVLAKRHGASSATVGVMLGIAAAGGLLGAILAPRLQRRLSPRMVLMSETWVFALSSRCCWSHTTRCCSESSSPPPS